ncbi:hypothetical protein DE83_09745 [Salmonella enterica subsp. enterica serovar Kentucky]|uniref:fumarylacetoacetate hydrolase family protein n=1 Tax=Salmonella enterica TaxID=28901 RepID=UPI00073744B8|nr:fumarylacetoacetate hydrolase family protein [Salmonella enterica]ECH7630970.1 fumarylacetoacetate hydrolase family protein [Salmonella enterica subsp. enterica serovar Kentucky]KUD36895.1 hypothetical protein DE83_09745 [Salmonella enterica subsp. enterica serovar Kentucky]
MKLVQYLVNGGKRYGIMQETGIIDLSQRLGDKYPTLKSLLCANALTDAALWCDEPADYMDGSVRDWQHSWFTAGKNWPSTGSFGPCLVTTDDIPDPQMLRLLTRLNGREVQNESTANMIHPIASLIAYISTFTLLSPGDTILTGSLGGVGKKRVPPLFLHDGDVIEVEIEHIGTLRNVVRDSRYLTSSVSWHDGRK